MNWIFDVLVELVWVDDTFIVVETAYTKLANTDLPPFHLLTSSLSGTTTATKYDCRESPYTKICLITSTVTNTFSSFSTAMYSPWDSLKMFFFLSMILRAPFGRIVPTSPVWTQPSSSMASLVLSWSLK